MPEVSFYVLASNLVAERYQFACKLIEKAYRSGVLPYVLTDDLTQSQHIDDLLWTFRPGSFVPHQIDDGQQASSAKVVLIGSTLSDHYQTTLINLSQHCPPNFQQLERIFEILDNSEETKRIGRERYRQYQQAGIEIITHRL